MSPQSRNANDEHPVDCPFKPECLNQEDERPDGGMEHKTLVTNTKIVEIATAEVVAKITNFVNALTAYLRKVNV